MKLPRRTGLATADKRGQRGDDTLPSGPHPKDVCVCGDYREEHENGTGICAFTKGQHGSDDGHFGAGRCDKFEMSIPAESKPWL